MTGGLAYIYKAYIYPSSLLNPTKNRKLLNILNIKWNPKTQHLKKSKRRSKQHRSQENPSLTLLNQLPKNYTTRFPLFHLWNKRCTLKPKMLLINQNLFFLFILSQIWFKQSHIKMKNPEINNGEKGFRFKNKCHLWFSLAKLTKREYKPKLLSEMGIFRIREKWSNSLLRQISGDDSKWISKEKSWERVREWTLSWRLKLVVVVVSALPSIQICNKKNLSDSELGKVWYPQGET